MNGIFFAAKDGFYFTDGYNVQKISEEFDETYKTLVKSATQRERIYGKHDVINQRVYWAVMSSDTVVDNDTFYVFDLKSGVKPNGVFTTVSSRTGGAYYVSLEVDNNDSFIVCDRRGYIFKFDDSFYSDLRVDTASNPSAWEDLAIVYDYKGPAVNFGSYELIKYITWINAIIENRSTASILIQHQSDDSGHWRGLKEIRDRSNVPWLDVSAPAWLESGADLPWLNFPLIKEKRRFSQNPLRCIYQQIGFTNSSTVITKSDDFGTATVNSTTKTVTLNTVTNSWDADITDYKIRFNSDSYVLEYSILTRDSATQITYSDPDDTSTTSATMKWEVVGIHKKERFDLVSYAIHWAPQEYALKPYRAATGGNA